MGVTRILAFRNPFETKKTFMRLFMSAPIFTLLIACVQGPEKSEATLSFFGTGYRFDGDICRRLGENSYTNQFLDDASDLVACPLDAENAGVFVMDTNATEVARRDGYILFSVPLR